MKRLVGLILIINLLLGCGVMSKTGAIMTGYTTSCINGVEYIQFTSGASVAFNSDGKVKLCGK